MRRAVLARSLRCDAGVPDPASAAARLLAALVFATTSLTPAVAAVASALGLPVQKNPSLVAQFKTSLGACWGATFSTPTVNTASEFKARSD